MKFGKYLTAFSVFSVVAGVALPANAITFDFRFDDTNDGTVTSPIVGTGSFSFDDPGNGTFDFFSLSNRDLFFEIGNDTWDDTDIETTSGTEVEISGTSGNRTLVLTGNGNGPSNGSLDLVDNTNSNNIALSFGPTGFEGKYSVDNGLSTPSISDYEATQQPVPFEPVPFEAEGAMGLVALGGFFGYRYYKKRKQALSQLSQDK